MPNFYWRVVLVDTFFFASPIFYISLLQIFLISLYLSFSFFTLKVWWLSTAWVASLLLLLFLQLFQLFLSCKSIQWDHRLTGSNFIKVIQTGWRTSLNFSPTIASAPEQNSAPEPAKLTAANGSVVATVSAEMSAEMRTEMSQPPDGVSVNPIDKVLTWNRVAGICSALLNVSTCVMWKSVHHFNVCWK